eukprot:scaffold10872_cov66-Cyclotella_meneghiniana.AAC.5
MSGLIIRQKIENRPGVIYDTKERTLSFTTGSLFSFPLHSTAYESDAASVRIPSGLRLTIHSASVGCKEMSDYVKISSGQGVSLKFSSEENGEMLPVWTFNWERSGEFWANGLGIEVQGPRIIRLAAVVDKGFKKGSALDVNVFGTVEKAEF